MAGAGLSLQTWGRDYLSAADSVCRNLHSHLNKKTTTNSLKRDIK